MQRILLALILYGSILFCAPAWREGLYLYEGGQPDVGTATVGRAALANDASAAVINPAGMTRLDGSQVLVGVQPLLVGPNSMPQGFNATGTTN